MGCASSGSFVPPENQVDDIWSVFKKDKLLGKGASGEVWSAKENKTGKFYAVKLLIKSDPGNQAMFEQEATILKKLNHPNILGYYNCYEVRPDGIMFCKGEYKCARSGFRPRGFPTRHSFPTDGDAACGIIVISHAQTADEWVLVTQLLQGGEFFDRLQALSHYSEKVRIVILPFDACLHNCTASRDHSCTVAPTYHHIRSTVCLYVCMHVCMFVCVCV